MDLLTPEQAIALLNGRNSSCIYLVGAGGCGMSALGHLLLDLGHTLAGSDLVLNDDILHLRARGARIHIGHLAEQIAAAHPVLVVYSSAIRLNNPELVAAQHRQIPVVRRATLLAALVNRQRGICVAGMHGKTTTSALLSYALEKLGTEPGYAIGASVPQLPRHARFAAARLLGPDGSNLRGDSTAPAESGSAAPVAGWFVAETDESDGTLREFQPEHALVLNIDEEHLDYYANLDAICREFLGFAEQTRGRLVFCADDGRLSKLFMQRRNAVSYGLHPLAAYRVAGLQTVNSAHPLYPELPYGSMFEVWYRGELLGHFATQLLGEKNALNAAAVIALLHQIGFSPDEIAEAIRPFRGAARRLQELFRDDRFLVFEDYGHHPSEIVATLRALGSLGRRRLLVAFQPHRFSRTQLLMRQFAGSFSGVDRLWLTEIYGANEPEIPGLNGEVFAAALRAGGQPSEYVAELESLAGHVRAAMQPGDLVLFIGAGDITRAAQRLIAQLRSEPAGENEALCAALASKLSADAVLRRDEPLARRTTLRVGGRADFYVEPASEEDLRAVLRFCGERKMPFVILGRGSNILIKDGGIRGVVVSLAHPHFARVEILGDRLHCGAGARLKVVATEAKRNGLTGIEFLEGIPGTIGGALRMNAGAMGSWFFEVVDTIRFMGFDGQVYDRKASEVNVEYRGCPLFKNHVALGAVLRGQPASREAIERKMMVFSKKRWDTQPAAPSAGCIFKNPGTVPAGRLIDELGLKGLRIGGAAVSEVHGNFIVNDGHATADDVLQLIDLIKKRAKVARGIDLEIEVEILGE